MTEHVVKVPSEAQEKSLAERLAVIEVQIQVEEAVKGLVEMVHEIDRDYSELAKTAKNTETLREDFNRRITEAEDLRSEVLRYATEIKTLSAKLEEQTRTAQALLSSLGKILESSFGKVLVTRPATREEVKRGEAIPVRQATVAELRAN